MKQCLDIAALAERLRIKRSTLYTWAEQGTIPHLKLGRLLRFDPDEIEAWLQNHRCEGIPEPTPPKRRHGIDNVDALIAEAKLVVREWEWATDNPVLKIAKEKVRNGIERWLTAEEEQRLLAASPSWLQEIILFELHTGLRRGEILKLHWSHGICRVTRSRSWSRKMARGTRCR